MTPPSAGRAAPRHRRHGGGRRRFPHRRTRGERAMSLGAPRLWTAGSRAFGPGCVFVRETGAVHLLSTWDEGIPEEIPHENLYGITFNAMNFVTVLSKMQGAATATRGHRFHVGLVGQLVAQGLPGGCVHRRRTDAAAGPPGQEPRGDRGHPGASVRVAEEALAVTTTALVPGVTERQLTAIFMEAMAAAGVTTPSGQDVAWITSPQEPWRRTNRDTPVQPGDLVAFEAGVVLGGYSGEIGRTLAVREGGTSTPNWPSAPAPCGAPPRRLPCRRPARWPALRRTTPPVSRSRRCRWPGARAGFRPPARHPLLAADGRRATRRSGHGVRADRLRLEGRRRGSLRAGTDRDHRRRTGVAGDDTPSPVRSVTT